MLTGNELAFPDPMRGGNQSQHNQNPDGEATGLTKRELFAAMAMQGLQSMFSNLEMATIYQNQAESLGVTIQENLAAIAINQADALIAELNK